MLEKIKQIIAAQLNISVDTIKEDSKIMEDLGADSLDMVELLMAFEDEFKTSISDELAVQIKTVGDIEKLINKN